jgi:hypothetical protein
MANKFGLHNFYHQLRRGFREARDFEVRYHAPRELLRDFSRAIGPATLYADGFLTLNPRMEAIQLLPLRYKTITIISEALRKVSRLLPPLKFIADSLFIEAVKQKTP